MLALGAAASELFFSSLQSFFWEAQYVLSVSCSPIGGLAVCPESLRFSPLLRCPPLLPLPPLPLPPPPRETFADLLDGLGSYRQSFPGLRPGGILPVLGTLILKI